MGKYLGAKYKFVRRVGSNLHGTAKAASVLAKRKTPPGQKSAKGKRRSNKMSDFGIQLLEKQKIRYIYNISEHQLRRTYSRAKRKSGDAGENLLALLELRLDNTVFKMGFAPTIWAARQFVNHGHFEVNGKRVNIPSYNMGPDDIVTVREKSKNMHAIRDAIQRNKGQSAVPYFSTDVDKLEGTVLHVPIFAELVIPVKINLVIEFYSR